MLALALQEHEENTIQGFPASQVFDEDEGGYIEARPRINQIKRALEQAQQEESNPPPGREYFLVDVRDEWARRDAEFDEREARRLQELAQQIDE